MKSAPNENSYTHQNNHVTVTYKPLWKLLIDRNLTKADLRKMTGIAGSTFSRMNKDEIVSLEVLIKICLALDCGLEDILDFYGVDLRKEASHE